MKKNTAVLSTILILVSFVLPLLAIAQDPGGGPDVPIDGGLSVLLAAGAAYGVKKYRDFKKDKDSGDSDIK